LWCVWLAAAALEAKGDNIQAVPVWQKILAIREQQLGLEHPDTAASLNRTFVATAEHKVSSYRLYSPANIWHVNGIERTPRSGSIAPSWSTTRKTWTEEMSDTR
jgi:hypothetical protein